MAAEVALCGALATFAAGCMPRDDGSPVDLVGSFTAAEKHWETGTIDFGTAQAHPFLRGGWSFDEQGSEQGWESYVWALGERSTIEVYLAEARALTLRFRVASIPTESRRQRITVRVNGATAGSVEVGTTFATYSLEIGRHVAMAGENRIDFEYDAARREPVAGKTFPRRLSVAWDWLALDGIGGAGRAPVLDSDEEGSRIVLPTGSRLDYFLQVRDRATLELDEVAWIGGGAPAGIGGVVLQARLSGDGQTERRELSAGESVRLRWDVPGERVLHLSLRGEGPFGSSGAASIGRLQLRSPQPATGLAQRHSRVAARCGTTAAEQPTRPANVVVYMVDTLRRDRLGVYGRPQSLSPRLDALAAEAVVYDRAVAQAPWTRPAVASLFTGTLPPVHGVEGRVDVLDDELPTLAGILGAAGYDTAAVVTNGNAGADFGLDRGFDTFVYLAEEETDAVHVLSDRVNDVALDWLRSRRAHRPFFLYVHTSDPHAPYTAGGPAPVELGSLESIGRLTAAGRVAPETRRRLFDLYDAEVAFNDRSFGVLLDELAAMDLLDDTLLVFLADHGEAFGEHDEWLHGTSLYGEQVDIPLIIRFPGGRHGGIRDPRPVAQVDVLPTILEWTGMSLPGHLDGASLVPGSPCFVQADVGRPVFSFLRLDEAVGAAVVRREMKLIRNGRSRTTRPSTVELYDLAADAAEARPIDDGQRLRWGPLRSLVELEVDRRDGNRGPSTAVLPVELAERLRALGYLR